MQKYLLKNLEEVISVFQKDYGGFFTTHEFNMENVGFDSEKKFSSYSGIVSDRFPSRRCSHTALPALY